MKAHANSKVRVYICMYGHRILVITGLNRNLNHVEIILAYKQDYNF